VDLRSFVKGMLSNINIDDISCVGSRPYIDPSYTKGQYLIYFVTSGDGTQWHYHFSGYLNSIIEPINTSAKELYARIGGKYPLWRQDSIGDAFARRLTTLAHDSNLSYVLSDANIMSSESGDYIIITADKSHWYYVVSADTVQPLNDSARLIYNY
jgi:hypothetical protein